MMVGRDIGEGWARAAAAVSPQTGAETHARPVLEVTGLTQQRAFYDISLQVRAGEIVGVFGLLGAGHVHLTRAIYGAELFQAGSIAVDGQPVAIRSPRDGRRSGSV